MPNALGPLPVPVKSKLVRSILLRERRLARLDRMMDTARRLIESRTNVARGEAQLARQTAIAARLRAEIAVLQGRLNGTQMGELARVRRALAEGTP